MYYLFVLCLRSASYSLHVFVCTTHDFLAVIANSDLLEILSSSADWRNVTDPYLTFGQGNSSLARV